MKADELGQRTFFLLLPPMERIREVRRRELALVDNFANAIRTADIKAYAQSLEALEHCLLWPGVVRAVEHLDPPASFRRLCFWNWLQWGDSLRGEVSNDLARAAAQIQGPAMTLFRGETMWNRRHRTYGMSWSTDVEVASHFANGMHRTCQGGSVVLKTRAPAEAIICASKLVDNRFEVHEILVGRR